MEKDWADITGEMKKGSPRAMAKLISWVENREPGWLEAMKSIFQETGKAHVVGITGSPGAGKSTLTDRLARNIVNKGFSVGIIAVDPSSPFTGGALLGDRIRMRDISMMEGVFVRSMATRGSLGGLSPAVRDVVKIMDAFGKDFILIETVGVGQDEVEIVKTADIVIVVCVPGQGDGIQAIKAGIMEIADIFVVNKADREGASQVMADIQSMLAFATDESSQNIPVIKTVATTGKGVEDLSETLSEAFKSNKRDIDRQEQQVRSEIFSLLEKEVAIALHQKWSQGGGLDTVVKQILARERDPYSLVQEMTGSLIRN